MLQIVRVTVCLVALGGAASCSSPEARSGSTSPTIRISLGRAVSSAQGGSGNRLLAGLLALPQFSMKVVTLGSFEQRLVALQEGSLDITTAVDDVAYQAFYGHLSEPSRRLDKIRGIALMHPAIVHLVIGSATNPNGNLRGMRVMLGSPIGNNSGFGEKLLTSAGVPKSEIRGEFLDYETGTARLVRGDLDAAVMTGMLPLDYAVEAMRGGARLRQITPEQANRLRVHYPLLKNTLIPRHTYPNQPEPVHTVSVALLLVCRADLSNDLVYEFTRAYFEDLPEDVSKLTDTQRAPATVVPLHPGAARYYRERELRR